MARREPTKRPRRGSAADAPDGRPTKRRSPLARRPSPLPWQPPPRPRWVERLNAHGDAAGGARHLVSLDGAEMRRTAQATTGLDDFGDPGWSLHYEVLVAALENESSLHLAGRLIARTEILRSLRNRLQLAALWKERPEILRAALAPPVFIVGSPRSGTSILLELLACDRHNRAPAMWEMLHPAEALRGEEARAVGDATTQFWHDLQPEYETMHANSGDLPNECIFITMNDFLSDAWGGPHVVPSYEAHLITSDHRPTYRFHRDVLLTLQQRHAGRRWLLKAPSHLAQLAALFAVYPEARIIQTHRDPLKTIPSTLSLLGTLKWMRCERVDLGRLAQWISRGQAASYEREIAQRRDGTLPDGRFVDVRYADLVTEPLATIESIYEQLGWPVEASSLRAMAEYLRHKPKGARGEHRYSLESMGLDAATEQRRFAFYRERFRVPEE